MTSHAPIDAGVLPILGRCAAIRLFRVPGSSRIRRAMPVQPSWLLASALRGEDGV